MSSLCSTGLGQLTGHVLSSLNKKGQLQARTQANLTYVIELLLCAEYEARLALRSSNDESDHPALALWQVRQIWL